MKTTFRTIAMFIALMGMTAVSCQKEDITNPTGAVTEIGVYRTVSYTIDGKHYQINLVGDAAWHDFLDRMFALAEEGHQVSFHKNTRTNNISATKEKVIFTTTNKNEAYDWANNMSEMGYEVTIIYDKATGTYTCIAIK